jgi:ribonuclease J
MCTGTQGEPYSILGRLSQGTNRQFDIQRGDTVVLSSTPIPGNEELVHRTINRLFQRGANVIYDAIAPVHVSGHASQEEMKLLLQVVQPQHLIPVHGELRHLMQHAVLAQEIGIPKQNIAVVENGNIVSFNEGEMAIEGRIPGGYVFVDGSIVGDVGPKVLREREALARDGVAIIHLLLDCDGVHLIEEPDIITRGFIFTEDAEELLQEAKNRIREVVTKPSNGTLERRVEEEMAKFFYSQTRRRPMVFVFASRSN